MKKKLFLDFDNTIVNTIKAICDLYNEDFAYYDDFKRVDPKDVVTWEFSELICTTKEYINEYFKQKRFFDVLRFMDSAKEIIILLSDIYDITIVSMGYTPNLKGKYAWVKANLPGCKFIGVNFEDHKDKSCVDMSGGIFVDDNPQYLIKSNAETKICFGEVLSYNADTCFSRALDWVELYQLLKY